MSRPSQEYEAPNCYPDAAAGYRASVISDHHRRNKPLRVATLNMYAGRVRSRLRALIVNGKILDHVTI